MIAPLSALLAIALQAAPAPAPPPIPLVLHAGQVVQLATSAIVSSKTAAVGDLVPLTVAEDVRIGGQIAIPRGTPAMGQVAAARAKGAFGQSGALELRPLYLTLGGRTIRLEGAQGAHGTVSAGSVVGLFVLSAGFTGRSAILPAGTVIAGIVLRETVLTPAP